LVWVLTSWKKKGTHEEMQMEVQEVDLGVTFNRIIRNKPAFTFILIRFLLDPVFYFLMFWVPKYLHEERGLSFERVGELFWIPFLALGLSNILGGWFSDKLISRNMSTDAARKWVMGLAAMITMVAPFISWVSSVELAIGLMSVLMLAHGFWITNYITAISDVFGKYATSTVVGLSGTAGAISAMIVNPFIGLIVENYSYSPLWVMSGIMYPLAFIVLILFIPQIKPMEFKMA
jgi:ACS family hexuronate transporter-like MFS transporter